jgi:hypothetical protein
VTPHHSDQCMLQPLLSGSMLGNTRISKHGSRRGSPNGGGECGDKGKMCGGGEPFGVDTDDEPDGVLAP